ncbi:MAG: hypothetical protein ACTSR3_01035 [Candidatus Helarchaeota archaeon]
MGINCGHCGLEMRRIQEVSIFDGIERELLQCPKCKAKIYIPGDHWNNYPMILQDVNSLDKWMKMSGESFTCPFHNKPLEICSMKMHDNINNADIGWTDEYHCKEEGCDYKVLLTTFQRRPLLTLTKKKKKKKKTTEQKKTTGQKVLLEWEK